MCKTSSHGAFWSLALLLAIGTGGAVRSNTASSRTISKGQSLYHQGLEAARNHDLATAIRKFRMTLEYLPKSPAVHYSLGSAYLQQGDINRAAVEFRKAIALKPEYAEAYFNMAVALERRNDLNGAITFYRYAVQLRPQWAHAHDALGFLLARHGELPAAQSELEAAIKIKPDLASAHLHLGTVLWLQHQHTQALVELRKAASLNPSSAEAHYYLEIAERQQEQPALNKARGKSAAANLASNRGEEDLLDGNLDAAIREFRSAIQVSPDLARAHYGLAWALRARGNLPEARGEFAKAHQLDPRLQAPAG